MKAKPKRKTTPKPNPEHYDYIKAYVDGNDLSLEYRLHGQHIIGRERHDEDVSEWSERDILALTRSMLSVADGDPIQIEVIYS